MSGESSFGAGIVPNDIAAQELGSAGTVIVPATIIINVDSAKTDLQLEAEIVANKKLLRERKAEKFDSIMRSKQQTLSNDLQLLSSAQSNRSEEITKFGIAICQCCCC